MSASPCTEESALVAGIDVHMSRGGNGPPLFFLQGAEADGWHTCHRALAEHCSVYVPHHPGFGITPRLEWINRINDLAVLYVWLLEELPFDRVHLLGHGVGGWLAADIATMAPHKVDRLILVDAMGLKPQHTDIRDIFLLTPEEIRTASFYKPEQVPEWEHLYGQPPTPASIDRAEDALEMLVRLCWKPYMHDPRLPYLLPRITRPSLVVWGREDAIVPRECGELYKRGLKDACLVVLDECGHCPHLEQPQAFAETVLTFLR